jgi:hypothetical protein
MIIIAVLLLVFSALSYSAVRTKSPTYDEPMHLLGAWVHRHVGDFRINMEDPPLWHYIAALPIGRDEIRFDPNEPFWREMVGDYHRQWPYSHVRLYADPSVDAHALFNRSRAMMLLFGVATGVLLATVSWQLAGPVAAIVATALFAFDPTFLAHSPLLKNDVAITFFFLLLATLTWRVCLRANWLNTSLLALTCGAALTTKFSGVLVAPMLTFALLLRSLLPVPWTVLGRALCTPVKRLLASLLILLICGLVGYLSIWAAYGFRYRAVTDADTPLNFQRLTLDVAYFRLLGRNPTDAPTSDQLLAEPSDLVTDTVNFFNDRRLLPEAWLAGFLFTHAYSQARSSFFLGEIQVVGTPVYFPVALLVKSPTGSVVALIAALVGGAWLLYRSRPKQPSGYLAILALGVPALVYLAFALSAKLNLGVRHILPLLPFLFILAGVVSARFMVGRKRQVTVAVLLLAVAIETVVAWPNYLAFFNAPSGGERGGLWLLGDSNLDWGQDLPALAAWQQRNPGVRLWLAYFGQADPARYGVRFINAPTGDNGPDQPRGIDFGGYQYAPPGRPFDEATDWGVLAISATHLQGIYLGDDPYKRFRESLRDGKLRPIAVLNGSLYLFRVGNWPSNAIPP